VPKTQEPDFHALFRALPGLYLILDSELQVRRLPEVLDERLDD
jgi:hypothetical protein